MRSLAIPAALLLVACADKQSAQDAPNVPRTATASAAPAVAGTAPATNDASKEQRAPAMSSDDVRPGMQGRTAEIVNPDNSAVVLLYYELAGLTPPIDRWVEDDSRVKFAQPIDKAPLRAAVRAELESAAAAVRGIGFIRLSMNANLSDYDPTYGEFTLRAFAPSSVVDFSALGQKVSLKFGNGRTAQIWRVPPAEAQAIRDKLGYFHNVSLDALLRITAVQPGPAGGTITTEVVEYEMREAQRGLTLGRVQIEHR